MSSSFDDSIDSCNDKTDDNIPLESITKSTNDDENDVENRSKPYKERAQLHTTKWCLYIETLILFFIVVIDMFVTPLIDRYIMPIIDIPQRHRTTYSLQCYRTAIAFGNIYAIAWMISGQHVVKLWRRWRPSKNVVESVKSIEADVKRVSYFAKPLIIKSTFKFQLKRMRNWYLFMIVHLIIPAVFMAIYKDREIHTLVYIVVIIVELVMLAAWIHPTLMDAICEGIEKGIEDAADCDCD